MDSVSADFLAKQIAQLKPNQQKQYVQGLQNKIADHVEKQLDDELKRLEELTEDDFAKMRQKRMRQLQEKADQRERWRQNGHGTLDEIMDQKQFYVEAKKSERVVVLFYTPGNSWAEILASHLAKLASIHYETRFLKMNAEKAQVVCQQLEIVMIPALVLCKDKKIAKQYRGLDMFTGGSSELKVKIIEQVLYNDGFLEEIHLDNADKMDYIREQSRQLDEEESDSLDL